MTQKTVSAVEAARWLAEGSAVLVDVRSPDEFRAEHAPLAVSMPLDGLAQALPTLAGRRVVFQCEKGGRGASACALAENRLKESYNLEGGLAAWKAAGLPVVAASRALPLFRQVQIVVGLIVLALVVAGFTLSPVFFALAGLIGTMLAVAGVTGWCGMALLLQRMPWNRIAAGG